MAHFENEITKKMRGWSVETTDAGTCFVPGYVVSVPDWLVTGVQILPEDSASEMRPHRQIIQQILTPTNEKMALPPPLPQLSQAMFSLTRADL